MDRQERVVYIEFGASLPLRPWEVITHGTDERGHEFTHTYDVVGMQDGRLLYRMSGACGSLYAPTPQARKPWWAAPEVDLKGDATAPIRLAWLPPQWRVWPPPDSIDSEFADCPICGFLPDEGGWPEDGYTPCQHLRWKDGEWALKKRYRSVA